MEAKAPSSHLFFIKKRTNSQKCSVTSQKLRGITPRGGADGETPSASHVRNDVRSEASAMSPNGAPSVRPASLHDLVTPGLQGPVHTSESKQLLLGEPCAPLPFSVSFPPHSVSFSGHMTSPELQTTLNSTKLPTASFGFAIRG